MATTQAEEKDVDSKEEEEKKEEVPQLGGVARLGKEYGAKYCGYTIGGYLFAFLNGCMMPLFGLLFREILDLLADVSACHSGDTGVDPADCESFEERSLRTLVYFVAMGTGTGVFTVLQFFFWGSYGTRVAIDIRAEWFESLVKQDIAFHDEKTSGTLNATLTTETSAIESGIGVQTGIAIQQLGSFLFGTALAFIYSWQLTLILCATLPVLICIGVIQGAMMENAAGDTADPFMKAGSFSQEVLTNIRTVYSLPTLVTSKYNDFKQEVLSGFPVSTKTALVSGVGLGFFMFGMCGIMYPVGLFAGSRFVADGTIGVGDMFGAFFCFMIAGMGAGQMGSALPDIMKASAASNRFFAARARVPNIRPADDNQTPIIPKENLSGALSFEDVSFAYATNADAVVLKGVSFSVKSGETLAIVGPSGSGKSTIVSLIERFYDPQSGDISMDGKKVHNYDVDWLRSQVGLVSQMPLLFDASVAENIRGGNAAASNEEVEQAARMANAHEFVMKLKDGYDTSVGELGGRLSGGQRQRIAIARAMLSKPSILLLDEATSALDSKSEREVQEAIDNIASSSNQTVIAIAHRLSTIKNADTIIVLVDGKIRESGNHSELMDKNGVYAALVNAQTLVQEKKQVHERRRSSMSVKDMKQLQQDMATEPPAYEETAETTETTDQ